MSRVRIARTPVGAHVPPPGAPVPDIELYRRLQTALRRYLSPATATVLAEPLFSADGSYIDWFTTLTGQPTRLDQLTAGEQSQARRLLQDRIRALTDLAQKIGALEPGTDLPDRLRQAATYPGDATVYAIGGQPVITFWGYGIPTTPAAATDVVTARSRSRWPSYLLMLSALIGTLTWAAFHFGFFRWPPWGPDYGAILAEERAEGDHLRRQLLDHRSELARTLGQCALRAQLETAQHEHALLASQLEAAMHELRRATAACEHRTAEAEGVELWERLTNLRQQLADAQSKCAPPAEDKKKPPKDPPDPEQQKKRAERERLRHVQVDGMLGCSGRSSRLYFKVPFDLGGGRFSVNFKGRDYDGTGITSRIDGTYDAASQRMTLDLHIVDRGQGKKAIRVDRCEGTWRDGTFHDPSCELIRTVGDGQFCKPLWLQIKTKTKLGKKP